MVVSSRLSVHIFNIKALTFLPFSKLLCCVVGSVLEFV